jgi:DNA phosphorothioation-dependent restriction protein DptG
MKVQVQAKDLLDALQGMDPDEVVFEYEIPAEELLHHLKERQRKGWQEKVRQEIEKVGVEAFFQLTEGRAAPVLEMQHLGDNRP